MKMYDGFAEDTWKLNRKLTLNLGARYDLQLTPPPAIPNTSSALAAKYNTTIKNVTDRVQPRFGFSWTPAKAPLFAAVTASSPDSTRAARTTPCAWKTACIRSTTTITVAAHRVLPPPRLRSPMFHSLHRAIPVGRLVSSGGAAPAVSGPTLLAAQSFHGLSPAFVPPLVHEFNLAVEQALPGKMSLSLGYVGSRDFVCRSSRMPIWWDKLRTEPALSISLIPTEQPAWLLYPTT